MVNDYIKKSTGKDFSAKDFAPGPVPYMRWKRFVRWKRHHRSQRKKNILAVLDSVSQKLGNSRAICKKYYVHPGLIRLYEEDNFAKYTANSGPD